MASRSLFLFLALMSYLPVVVSYFTSPSKPSHTNTGNKRLILLYISLFIFFFSPFSISIRFISQVLATTSII